jgi:hypothetical protein
MSVLNVNSIASLEALNGALSQYRTASGEPFRRFAPIFGKKMELLEQLETHFVERVEQAAHEVSYAQRAYSACMGDPNRTSCSYERSALHHAEAQLEQAQANLANYRSQISRLRSSLASYNSAAGRYENNLHNISSSIVPNFSSLIGEMKAYSYDDSNIAGGITAGTLPGYTGGGTGVAGGARLENKQDASEARVLGDDTYDTGKRPIYSNGMDATLGDNATANVENANDISMATAGGGIVAGIGVAALSAGILMHFRNNGVDSHFASREIDRVLTAKYGTPLGLLPPEKQAEYVKDYNALSKAVEEDVKKKHAEEIADLRRKENEIRAKNGQISIEEAEQQYEYASLAEHVYSPNRKLPENWSKVSSKSDTAYELTKEIKRLNKDGSGFYAQLYKNDTTGEYTLAFRGTELTKPNDLAADGLQAIGLSKQYENAQLLGKKINDAGLNQMNFKIVGHSLGGGLASVAGLESRCETYSYNQAELSQPTIGILKLNTDEHEKLITQYLDRDQWLNKWVQDPVNNALSEKSMVAINKSESNFAQRIIEANKKFETDSPDNFFARLGTIKTIDSKGEHGIDSVKNFFDSQRRQDIYGNNKLQNFHISPISKAPTIEDSSLKYFQQAAKEEGIIGIASKK